MDATELYVDYPVGTAVTIHCNGLFLCDYGGKVMLGTRPTDEYAGPGRIPQAEAALYLRRKQAETREPVRNAQEAGRCNTGCSCYHRPHGHRRIA